MRNFTPDLLSSFTISDSKKWSCKGTWWIWRQRWWNWRRQYWNIFARRTCPARRTYPSTCPQQTQKGSL